MPVHRMVQQLMEILDEKYIIQVYSTPTSDKPTLAGLLLKQYQNRNVAVVLTPSWPRDSPKFYSEIIVEHARLARSKLTVARLPKSDFVLILDEAQILYGAISAFLNCHASHVGTSSYKVDRVQDIPFIPGDRIRRGTYNPILKIRKPGKSRQFSMNIVNSLLLIQFT